MKTGLVLLVFVTNVLMASGAMAQTLLLKNARLVTMSEMGIVDAGSMLVKDGVIEEVSTRIEVSADIAVIDLKNQFVTPGLIDSASQLGLIDVNNFASKTDNQVKGLALGAGFSPVMAINRYSSMISMVRNEGITRAHIKPVPGSSIFAGQGAMIHLVDKGQFVTDKFQAVHVYLRESDKTLAGGSRAAALAEVIDSLQEANRYRQNPADFRKAKGREFRQSEADLISLASVLDRGVPLVVHVDRAADIENMLSALGSFELKIYLAGAREAWKVKALLADLRIPVIINVLDNLPSRFDRLGARLDNAALLVEAGVTVAFMTDDLTRNTRNLTQGAGVAVAYGLSWQEAMKAITVSPASLWGLENTGRLVPGFAADLVVWDGDPLEVTSSPVRMMIGGSWIELRGRQELLRDRYSDLHDGKVPFGYR